MAILVRAGWVAERIDSPDMLLLDPRRPMKYLQGHLENAVNLPLFQAFDVQGQLLSPDVLARWIGAAGLGEKTTPVLYDSPTGRTPPCWPGSSSTSVVLRCTCSTSSSSAGWPKAGKYST